MKPRDDRAWVCRSEIRAARPSASLLRHINWIAHDDTELREWEVDGHPAPRIRRPIAGARDRKGNNWPPRPTADHNDAGAAFARRTWRHVSGQSDAEAFSERGNQPVSGLGPSPIAAAATASRSGSAHEPETEMAKHAGKRFRVVVPCDDGAAGNLARINAWQEKKLSVPQSNYRGVQLACPADKVRGIGNNRRRVDDEFDVIDDGGSKEDLHRSPQPDSLPPEPRNLPQPRHRSTPSSSLFRM